PNQLTAPFRLDDGTEVTVRAVAPEDGPLIIALHAGHSPHTIRMRFFSMVKTLSRDSLLRLCHLDYDREMALLSGRLPAAQPQAPGAAVGTRRVALLPASRDGRGRVRGGGRRPVAGTGSRLAPDGTADRRCPAARRQAAGRRRAARERDDVADGRTTRLQGAA